MIEDLPSTNREYRRQDDRPAGLPVEILVPHDTAMSMVREAIDRLRDPAARVSSHDDADEDGTTCRLVPEERRAFHAGVSYWRGATELTARSIGIEIVIPAINGVSGISGPATGAATSSPVATRHPSGQGILAKNSTGKGSPHAASVSGLGPVLTPPPEVRCATPPCSSNSATTGPKSATLSPPGVA